VYSRNKWSDIHDGNFHVFEAEKYVLLCSKKNLVSLERIKGKVENIEGKKTINDARDATLN
jgi:uncharacterized protein YunC (DUF1805 family)